MRNDHDEELTPEERRLLDALPREESPPPALEERVVAGLQAEGQIRAAPARRRWPAIAAMLAISIALSFFAGTRFGAAGSPPSPPAGPAFVLLVYDRPGTETDALTQAAVAEATEWVGELVAGGSFQAAAKLSDDGSRVELVDEELVVAADVPAISAELVLGGFFLISADSYEDARRIAATCPLLRYGSTIEVRAVEAS